jgi:hypothetical protein
MNQTVERSWSQPRLHDSSPEKGEERWLRSSSETFLTLDGVIVAGGVLDDSVQVGVVTHG